MKKAHHSFWVLALLAVIFSASFAYAAAELDEETDTHVEKILEGVQPFMSTPERARAVIENLPPVSKEEMIEDFRNVAFGIGGPSPNEVIEKWSGPIRFLLLGERKEQLDNAISGLFRLIARWSQLDVKQIYADGKNRNFLIMFVSSREIEQIKKKIPFDDPNFCMQFFNNGHESGVVSSTSILVDRDLSGDKIVECAIRSIFVGMGLNETPETEISVLDIRQYPVVRPKDEVFVRLLYDARIQPGQSWEDIKEVVEKIVHENRYYGQLRWSSR